MKYWVYKDARVLGPFERESMAGLPGFDAGTLVCVGESPGGAEGNWRPAGDVPELSALAKARPLAWTPDQPGTFGLLDKLLIDSAGGVGGQAPSAPSLFQDAEPKQAFADLLLARTRTDDAEIKRLRALVSEMSIQMELLYRRLAQVEIGQAQPPAFREAPSPAAYAPPPPRAPAPPLAPEAFAPSPPEAPTIPPAASAAPSAPPAPGRAADPLAAEWEKLVPQEGAPGLPALARSSPPPAPAPPVPVPPAPALRAPVPPAPEPVAPPAPAPQEPAASAPLEIMPPEPEAPAPLEIAPSEPAAELPLIPVLQPQAGLAAEPAAPPDSPPLSAPESAVPTRAEIMADLELMIDEPPAAAPQAPPEKKKLAFEKPKTFKVVPAVKSFRSVGAPERSPALPAGPEIPAPRPTESGAPPAAFSVPAAAPESAPFAPLPAVEAPAPLYAPPIEAPPAAAAPPPLAEPMPVLAPAPAPSPLAAAEAPTLVPAPAQAFAPAPTHVEPPAPVESPAAAPAFGSAPTEAGPQLVPFGPSPSQPVETSIPYAAPPITAAFGGGQAFGVPATTDPSALQPTPEVLARLAKPASVPVTAAPRPRSGGRGFLVAGGLLVGILAGVGFLFLRQPKDLTQMAQLDDGRASIGAEPVDDASRPANGKPPQAPGAVPGAAPAAPAASSPAPAASAPAASVQPSAVPAMPTSPAVQPPAAAQPPAPGLAAPSPSAAPNPAASSPPSAAPAPAAGPGAEAAPPGEAGPAAAPTMSGREDAAVAFVKNFPLDGGRGTLAQWLQFSYSATPDAGQESWKASETADKTFIVEYLFTPTVKGAPEVHYVFEADVDRGYVIGRTPDAKSMLAAGGPSGAKRVAGRPRPKSKLKAKTKTAARRKSPARRSRRRAKAPPRPGKPVPLLPLPSEGELHAPSDDDGTFAPDAAQSGL